MPLLSENDEISENSSLSNRFLVIINQFLCFIFLFFYHIFISKVFLLSYDYTFG